MQTQKTWNRKRKRQKSIANEIVKHEDYTENYECIDRIQKTINAWILKGHQDYLFQNHTLHVYYFEVYF